MKLLRHQTDWKTFPAVLLFRSIFCVAKWYSVTSCGSGGNFKYVKQLHVCTVKLF